jgi:stage III sporulation protein SpoIIIAA
MINLIQIQRFWKTIFLGLLLFILLGGCIGFDDSEKHPVSMKGYELYSWQIENEWYFSLIEGTNRLKTYEEVTSEEVTIKGIIALNKEIARLPKGDTVFFNRNLEHPDLQLPPESIIQDIKTYCNELEINCI